MFPNLAEGGWRVNSDYVSSIAEENNTCKLILESAGDAVVGVVGDADDEVGAGLE